MLLNPQSDIVDDQLVWLENDGRKPGPTHRWETHIITELYGSLLTVIATTKLCISTKQCRYVFRHSNISSSWWDWIPKYYCDWFIFPTETGIDMD